MKYRINYSKVVSQANSISGNADQLSVQIRLLDQIEQECRSIWKGEAADVFISKIRSLRSEMDKTRFKMLNLASTIQYCADRIQSEDRAAEERAATLNAGY